MRTYFVRLLVLAALALPGTALAQGNGSQPAKTKPAATSPNAKAPKSKASKSKPATSSTKKVKQIDITEGDDVEGGVAGATGSDVTVIGKVVHTSLLRLRMDFNDHLIRSAERL